MAVVAPTGVAAINAGGVTIHSLFQIPPGTYLPSSNSGAEQFDGKIYNNHTLFRQMRMNAEKKELLRELDLLIIDEVSMVRADLLDAIDAVLRYIRKQPLTPFGGVQVLYIGDLFQLPPVVLNEEWELLRNFYRSPFFFDAQIIQQAQPVYIELKKIYRQTDDLFINILNNIRNNCCTESDLAHLHKYYQPEFSPSPKENFITLTTHNDKAILINNTELKKLPGKSYSFKAEITGDFHERSFPAEEILYLKKGAQVMLIKNDSGEYRRYYNGKIGLIHSIDEERVQITFPGETTLLTLEKEGWKNIRYQYNTEKDSIEEEELGTFSQYPVRLAWAITIHKSQGLTFRKAIIDAGASFAAGQVYVALSRLTSLNGLVLKSAIYPHCIHTDERVLEWVNKELPEDVLHKTLHREQEYHVRFLVIHGFGWGKILDAFQDHVESYEARKLPDIKMCIDWAKEMIKKTISLQETGSKFQKQLEQLFEEDKEGQGKQVHDRISAAGNYFIKETNEKLLASLEKHIETIKIKSRTKKYLNELYELKHLLLKRVCQLQNIMNISQTIYGSGTGADIVKAVENLQKPIVIDREAGKKKPAGKKIEKGESQRISLQLFKKGKSIADVAKERNLAFSTVEGHLAGFITTGEIDILSMVDKIKLEKVSTLIEKNPLLTSSELKQKLGDAFSYGEIRAVMNYKTYISEIIKAQ